MKKAIALHCGHACRHAFLLATLFLPLTLHAQVVYYTQYSGSGSVSKLVVGGSTTTLASSLNFPSQLALDAGGNLYVSNQGAHNVFKITPGGAVTTFVSGITNANGLAFDSAGNLYVSSTSGVTITKVTPAGAPSTYATLTG